MSHPDVFAAGDVAAVVPYPREKAGVIAVRQGKPLARNLRRVLTGRAPRPFVPQRKWLALISTGDKYAIASRGNWSVEGRWVWPGKTGSIAVSCIGTTCSLTRCRRSNSRCRMDWQGEDVRQELADLAMRCGGCGAKVGATVLQRALARLHPSARADVLIGLTHPDDAAVVAVPTDKVMVHTVDFFRAIVDDPYVFGKIAANHSLGDIFAMGAERSLPWPLPRCPMG